MLLIDPIPPDPEININYDEELQEEESYSFLVKRIPINCQTNRISKTLIPEVISEMLSDDDSDNAFEENNEQDFEDNTLEYSSDELEEYCQVNFDAPDTE